MSDKPRVVIVRPGRSSAFSTMMLVALTGLAASPRGIRRYDDDISIPSQKFPGHIPTPDHPIRHSYPPSKYDSAGIARFQAAEARRQSKAKKKAANIRKANAGRRKK